MRTEKEPESPTMKLPLLLIPMNHPSPLNNPNNSYDLITTQTTTSIPFKWEQEPGKPILSPTQNTQLPSHTTLELPPRLQLMDQGSFSKSTVAEMVRSERAERRKKGMFGSWGGVCVNKEVSGGGGSFVFPSDYDCADEGGLKRVKRVRRNPSFSNLRDIKSYFWVSMYEGLKQVMPWRSRKSKKQG